MVATLLLGSIYIAGRMESLMKVIGNPAQGGIQNL